MEAQLKDHLHLWEKVDDLEIIPGDRIEPTLSRTTRRVPCLLKPGNRESLIQVVAIARENRIPFYPISRGKNWGYGAHLPVKDGCVIVSLEKLRHIGPCDPESGKVFVEAGVSQMDLYNYLEKLHPEFCFNVTAGGSDTSIIGNCLERGIGYHSSRSHDLHGLEVLTIDGEILKHDPRLWHPSHPDGIGAGWESLFFQSNYGIILGGWFNLMPRQDKTVFVSIQNSSLGNLLSDFRKLYRNQLIRDVTHIADPGRKKYMVRDLITCKHPKLKQERVDAIVELVGTDDYQGITALHGKASVIRACIREIKKMLAPTSQLQAFTPEKVARISRLSRWVPMPKARNMGLFLESVGDLLALSNGYPTNIGFLALKLRGDNPNFAEEIAVYLNATLPPGENSHNELKNLLTDSGYKYSITFIVNEQQAVSAIITLHFEVEKAAEVQEALKTLTLRLIELGFPPYRAGIDQMEYLGMPPINSKLKDFFDPMHLIAPGRYT